MALFNGNNDFVVVFGNGGGSSVGIDPTLTKEGYAADAKATGDRITELDEKLDGAGGGGGTAIILTKNSKGADLIEAGTAFLESSRQVLFEAVNTENNTIYCTLISIWNNTYYYFIRPDTKQIIKITFPGLNKEIGNPEYIDLGTGSGGGDVVTPIFQVIDTDKLQVSYDNGATWEDLATLPKGDKGDDGEDGITPQFKIDDGDLAVSYDEGENWDNLGSLPKGDQGDAGNITINGTELKFFTGTKAQYDALSDAEKENLFAIITDDEMQDVTMLARTMVDIIDALNSVSTPLEFVTTMAAKSSDKDPTGEGTYPVYLEKVVEGKILTAELVEHNGFAQTPNLLLTEKDNGKIIVNGKAIKANSLCYAKVKYTRTFIKPRTEG